MKTEHPYRAFEQTRLWELIEKVVTDLESNRDLQFTTAPEYIVGYICKQLANHGVSIDLISN